MGNIMKRELIGSKIFAPKGAHYPVKRGNTPIKYSKRYENLWKNITYEKTNNKNCNNIIHISIL